MAHLALRNVGQLVQLVEVVGVDENRVFRPALQKYLEQARLSHPILAHGPVVEDEELVTVALFGVQEQLAQPLQAVET